MPIIIVFAVLFLSVPLSYGQGALKEGETLQEEADIPYYVPVYRPALQIKESHAYYNRHAGQMVEVSTMQPGPTSSLPFSGRAGETRSFYNRHAGQRVEMPLNGVPRKDSKQFSWSLNRENEVYKYNPYSRQWEKTGPETQLTYNPHDSAWSYEKEGAYPRYNPYSKTWEQATDNEVLQYNHENDSWSYRE